LVAEAAQEITARTVEVAFVDQEGYSAKKKQSKPPPSTASALDHQVS
jgi:hypothetical protein